MVAVIVVMVFLGGAAYVLSAADQGPRVDAARTPACFSVPCGSCSLPCIREHGHGGDHCCRNEHGWPRL
jgi:hypothetical protein